MRGAIAIVACIGCQGTVGTVDVTLAVSPGSTLLDNVQTLKLTLTNPAQTQTAQKSAAGAFSIDIQLDATGDSGAILLDGLDANGTVIATGASPPFPFGGIAADVVIFMAAPNSISPALVTLDPARSAIASAAVSYGSVLVGGTNADGTASAVTAIYNAFDHQFQVGVPLPTAKTGVALAIGTSGNYAYIIGGTDSTGAPTSTVQRFDTSVSPSGSITDLGAFAGLERTGQTALSIGNENILVTGTPPAVVSGSALTMTARTDVASLAATSASTTGTDGVGTALFASAAGIERYRNGVFDMLAVPARDGMVGVALGTSVGFLCGAGDLIRVDAAAGTATSAPVPSTQRAGCAAAVSSGLLVVAGGTLMDGSIATNAEIYDASTLALVATQPLTVPRTNAVATTLPNGQIMIVGGVDASNAPIGTIELFTPESMP